MRAVRMQLAVFSMAAFMVACGTERTDVTAPAPKIETVDELLARACELAADCVSATPQEIAACPADLRMELSASQLTELEGFLTLDKSTQDSILTCFDTTICGRFGVSLLNISDADLMEPLRNCP